MTRRARRRCPGCRRSGRGDDLAALLARRAPRGSPDPGLRPGDVLAVAHKAVAKAEGRVVPLADVTARRRARGELAAEHGKDPRLVELILAESAELVRADAGPADRPHPPRLRLRERRRRPVQRRRRGRTPCCSPSTPTRPRARCAPRLGCAVVVTDSFGRAWRIGQAEVAIGCAGLAPLDDWRGRPTPPAGSCTRRMIAIADEAASAADLVRGKDSGEPAVRLRGLERHVLRRTTARASRPCSARRSRTCSADYAAAPPALRCCCCWIARRMSNRSRAASTWRPRASDQLPSARIGAASVAPSGVSA